MPRLAPLASLLLTGILVLQAAEAQSHGAASNYFLPQSGWQQKLDPVLRAESHLMTNVPSNFAGMDVNDFIGADRFYSAGYTGSNTISANVEAGHVWGTGSGHETLTHVTSYSTGTGASGAVDRHATWCGMIIGGRNGGSSQGDWQTGVARNTDLRSGALATAWTGNAYALSFSMTSTSFLTAYDAYFGTANVINSSWGYSGDAGGTSAYSVAFDAFIRSNSTTTLVASAGNSGPGSNTVGGAGAAYNAITVGALGSANDFDSIANFSSRGPQDYADGVNGTINGVRAAVDITAPGESLTSAYYGGQTGGNDSSLTGSPSGDLGDVDYYSVAIQGTSFAAPIVAGGVALLNDASIGETLGANSRNSRIIKAVLLNSADKPTGWDNGQADSGGVITTTQSLDWDFGAGRMNLDEAYDQYLNGTTDVAGTGGGTIDQMGWDLGSLTLSGSNDYVISGSIAAGDILTATLVWYRNRTVDVVAETTNDVGFADFDLEIWDSTFTTKYATSKSDYNSVEHLYYTVGTTGTYGIRVLYSDQIFGSSTTESYGLAWSSGHSAPEPGEALLLLTLALSVVPLGLMRPRCRRA